MDDNSFREYLVIFLYGLVHFIALGHGSVVHVCTGNERIGSANLPTFQRAAYEGQLKVPHSHDLP